MKKPVAKLNAAELVEQLSASERRALENAERTITRGFKAFVAVGAALKEIRDRRLYREQFRTFEEYCGCRWEISRPRGYELCAAAEVVEDLSAIADIRLLPENEAQARPLARLKHAELRQRAWQLAVRTAAAHGRPVTAKDSEQAVKDVNGGAYARTGDAVMAPDNGHRLRSLPEPPVPVIKPKAIPPGRTSGSTAKIHRDLTRWLDAIHLGDCRELLMKLPDASIDALITDAPYGVGKGRWDVLTKELVEAVVREGLRVMKPASSFFWFGHNETTAELWSVFKPLRPRWLTWFYRNASNISQQTFGWNSQVIVYGHKGQPVFNVDAGRVPYSPNTSTKRVNHDDSCSRFGIRKNGSCAKRYHEDGRKPMDVIECPAVTAGVAEAEGRWHPTQKPLKLMRLLVSLSTNPGDVVVDPFCGSGTTCLAAKQLGRHFIGFEREPGFARKARQRLAGG